MNLQKLSIGLLVLLLVSSCKKSNDYTANNSEHLDKRIELTNEEIISVSNDNPRTLTEAEIISKVRDFKDVIKTKTKSGLDNITFKVTNITGNDLKVKSGNYSVAVPTYKVEIKGENIKDVAIVSADSRAPTVLAYYSVSDSLAKGDAPNGPLLELSNIIVAERIKKIDKLKDSLRQKTLVKISKKYAIDSANFQFEKYRASIVLKTAKVKSNRVDDVPADGTLPYGPVATTEHRVYPLIPVAWSNGMPYNRLMSQTCPNNWLWDNRIPISSSSIAIAQVCAFLQIPVNANGTVVDWNYLTENEEILEEGEYFGTNPRPQDPLVRRNMVASLLKYIGEQCGVSYTCTSSSVYTNSVISFFQSRNVNLGTYQDFNFDVVQSSIQNIEPVLMFGQTNSNQGHWWVVDGFVVQKISWDPSDPYASWWHDKYIHANMGQGRDYKGYYLVQSPMTFNAEFAHFTTNLKMIPNIVPR